MKNDNTGLFLLLIIGIIFLIVISWISNTGGCLNYRTDMSDFMERFKWCAVNVNYIK